MNWLLVGILSYLGIQLAIGLWVSRRVRSESDYILAGRSLGLGLASFSIFATWFGAEAIQGAAGTMYEDGLSGGSADPFGYVLCILLVGLVFARPLWARGYTTFGDLFRERYSTGVERFVILLVVPTSVIWAAAQVRAFGNVMSHASGLPLDWAITAAAAFILLYTTVGGLLADAWTDLVQGLAIVVGLVALAGVLLVSGDLQAAWREVPAERLALLGDGTLPWYGLLEAWVVPVVGSMLAVELLARVLGCRSAEVARRACFVGGGLYLAVGLIPAVLGLCGPFLAPGLDDAEQLVPELARLHLGTWLYVPFAGALISAILSTVDSCLLAGSSLLTHNVVLPLAPTLSERAKLRLSRIGVLSLGVFAYVLALGSEGIKDLVEFASAFGSAGVFVVACFGLFTGLGGPLSAWVGLCTGFVVWGTGAWLAWPAPYATALAVSGAAYLATVPFSPGRALRAVHAPSAEAHNSRRVFARLSLTLTLGLACILAGCGASPPADLVILGGPIITLDDSLRRVESVAIRSGRLIVVGTADEARAVAGPETRVVDLGGRVLLPAFHDAHVHPVSAGVELGQCNLNDLLTAEAILARVAGCVEAQRGRPWLVGGGFVLTAFPAGAPDRTALDRLTGDQPAALSSSDGHTLWANTAALRVAGITRDTADPVAGRIERDPRGEPTGVLRESAAGLVGRHVPPPTTAEYEAGLVRALALMARVGIVSFHESNADATAVGTYRAVARNGGLTARARLSLSIDPTRDHRQVDALIDLRTSVVEPGLSAGAAKIFLDGVIEAGTAALLEPYVPLSGEQPAASRDAARGLPTFTDEALAALVTRLDRAGFQVHMHAIGDRAIRQGLDAIAAADRANGPRDRRAHLAHIQLVDPADQQRFAALGVVANIQPLWAFADAFITDLTEPRLGPRRSRYLYPFASLAKAGARLAAGSDWSVTSVNPLHGIQVAVTRTALEAPADAPAWLPDERLDLTSTLQAYTRGGAYLSFEDEDSGAITAGRLADLIVLDRDPYAVARSDLHRLQVLWTLEAGREVFRAESFTPLPR